MPAVGTDAHNCVVVAQILRGAAGGACLRTLIPGDFHEHIDEPELHPAAFATAVMLLAVGGVTAAAQS